MKFLVWVPSADSWPGLPAWLLRFAFGLLTLILPISVWIETPTKALFQRPGKHAKKNTKYLFVANHNVGGFDVAFTYAVIYYLTGLYPRGLADRGHFYLPLWAHFYWFAGAVVGSREVCRTLMEREEPILVFPGGGNEVFRTPYDPKYSLKWKQRSGFARLAKEHGYTIIPISLIGIADMLRVIWNLPFDWVWKLLGDHRMNQQFYPPIMIPTGTYERLYVHVGSPITTNLHGSDGSPHRYNLRNQSSPRKQLSHVDQEKEVIRIRDATLKAVESGITKSLTRQAKDPDRYVWNTWYRTLFKNHPHESPFGVSCHDA